MEKTTAAATSNKPTPSPNPTEPSQASMHITVHRLNGHNYLEWSQSVKLAIDGRGKLGYLTGEVKVPKDEDDGYKTWRSENSLVTAWLLNSMDAAIAKPHLFMKTAKDIWDSIRETYSDLENSSQIFELKTRLWQSKQGSRDVISYYNEMVALWQELDQCHDDEWENKNDQARHQKREENDRVYMFLAGVNQELDEVKGRILGRQPLPSIREVFSTIRLEENRRKIMYNPGSSSEASTDTSALFVKGGGHDGITERNRGVTTARNCGTQGIRVGKSMANRLGQGRRNRREHSRPWPRLSRGSTRVSNSSQRSR